MDYAKEISSTPQNMAASGKDQVKNNAGGFVFQLDQWGYLRRFLILGSESPTYYQSIKELSIQNATNLIACIKSDPQRVYALMMEMVTNKLAPKPDTLVFTLACLLKHAKNPEVIADCVNSVNQVCYSGTQILQLASFIETFHGWSPVTRRAINNWYKQNMLKDNLGLQLIKYQNRNGWSHRDVLRLSHPKPLILPDGTSAENELYRFAVGKATQESIAQSPVYSTIKQFGPIVGTYKATKAESAADVVKAIRDYQLPRECIPTQHLNNALVWDALLEKMPVTAMLRNLGKMGAVSLLVNKSEAMKKVISVINKIGTEIKIVHPIQVLQALKVYGQGCGELGDNTWKPVPEVVAALDTAFYASFKNVKPTGKRVNLALDVSGSMATAHIAGLSNISAREASMAMAMVNYRVEENCYVNAFYTAIASKTFNAFASREVSMSPIEIGEADTITTMCGKISNLNFTATDCAAPMITALKNKQLFDAFVIYTDNETWSGKVHPFEALKQYRKATGIPAKLIVVGMTATKFTIADPSDSGMLDVVGFSSDAPAVISEFISS